jgi:transcriptional regulator with XRE-family HTH domain
MTDFFEQWANQNEANAKLVAQEVLITQATEEIWRAMEEAGINKAELAKKMGVTKGHISQILNGSRNMTLRTLADICFALDYQLTLSLEPKINKVERKAVGQEIAPAKPSKLRYAKSDSVLTPQGEAQNLHSSKTA